MYFVYYYSCDFVEIEITLDAVNGTPRVDKYIEVFLRQLFLMWSRAKSLRWLKLLMFNCEFIYYTYLVFFIIIEMLTLVSYFKPLI